MLLLFLTSYFFSLSSLFHVHLSFSSSFYFSSAPNLNFLIFISNALSSHFNNTLTLISSSFTKTTSTEHFSLSLSFQLLFTFTNITVLAMSNSQ